MLRLPIVVIMNQHNGLPAEPIILKPCVGTSHVSRGGGDASSFRFLVIEFAVLDVW